MTTRVGDWKLTDGGTVVCIAEGDGYVMYRNKSRFPQVMEVRLWDESLDTTAILGFEIDVKPNPPKP